MYDLKIVNNEVNIFTKNGYLLIFNYSNGNFEYIKQISKKGISSDIVFFDSNMILMDNSNKLLKF